MEIPLTVPSGEIPENSIFPGQRMTRTEDCCILQRQHRVNSAVPYNITGTPGGFMKKNMGTVDRAIRAIFALVVVYLIVSGTLSGLAAVLTGILAAVFLLTSVLSVCPVYLALKISTAKR